MGLPMDSYLAELFNTNGYAEKVAMVRENVDAFIKMASDEGYDLSSLNEDQIVEAANEWGDQVRAGADGGYEGGVEGPGNLGPKTAEADFLGRYMAHAYHDELTKIADTPYPLSGREYEGGQHQLAVHEGAGSTEEARAKRRGERFKQHVQSVKQPGGTKGPINLPSGQEVHGRRQLEAPSKLRQFGRGVREHAGKAWDLAKKHPYLAAGIGATALAGGAGATYLATRDKEKKSHIELLDELAVERANELIVLADQGQNVTFSKVASTDTGDLDRVVTELAWAKLQEAGYIR